MTGCQRTMFPNRISYCFDFSGPSQIIDTACASSLYALYQAVNDIRNGVCDSAIVGGSHLLLLPQNSYSFLRHGMLSPDGACKTFDSSANGYVRYVTFKRSEQ